MLSRGAISQLKCKRLNKSSNGSVSPTVERLRCYYRYSDLWTSLFHIFRFNKRDTAIKLALRKKLSVITHLAIDTKNVNLAKDK